MNSLTLVGLDAFEKGLKEQGIYESNAMFVRGGYWRNFFAKYPESNHMHYEMLRVSEMAGKAFVPGSTPPEILDNIRAGQCNDPYWHGLLGGLYLPNFRFLIYRSLLKAEKPIELTRLSKTLSVESCDFDCDGNDELIVKSALNNVYFKPDSCGCPVELSSKPRAVNLLDVLCRREESPHCRLLEAMSGVKAGQGWDELPAKEKDLHKHIFFDWNRHASLLDHFFDDTLQATIFLPFWDLRLEANGHMGSHLRVNIKQSLRYWES